MAKTMKQVEMEPRFKDIEIEIIVSGSPAIHKKTIQFPLNYDEVVIITNLVDETKEAKWEATQYTSDNKKLIAKAAMDDEAHPSYHFETEDSASKGSFEEVVSKIKFFIEKANTVKSIVFKFNDPILPNFEIPILINQVKVSYRDNEGKIFS